MEWVIPTPSVASPPWGFSWDRLLGRVDDKSCSRRRIGRRDADVLTDHAAADKNGTERDHAGQQFPLPSYAGFRGEPRAGAAGPWPAGHLTVPTDRAVRRSCRYEKTPSCYLMEDMATKEIRLSILWEWLHKATKFSEADEATGVAEGDKFSAELFARLLAEESAKLRAASNRDVHDDSKNTALPVARDRRDLRRRSF